MTLFILLSTPLIAGCISALLPRTRVRALEYLAIAASAVELAAAVVIANRVAVSGPAEYATLFTVDALSAFAALFMSFVGFAAAIHSVGHLRAEANKGIIGFRRIRQYFMQFHLFLFAMFLAVTTSSPLIMWVAIEATTLSTAFLITFYNKPSALEAGWKYLIVNSVGLLLAFFGTLLFLNAAADAGAGPLVTWSGLTALGSLDPLLITVAIVFVFVGYGTKVGFVPMHTWLPDAHSKAPVPISALLSGVLLNVALIAILRFKAAAQLAIDPLLIQHLLIGFGMLSLVIAALIIFAQKNYKRMLAYSSIEHMGILALGFGFGGAAVAAALLHMLYHALLKPILFLSAGNFFLKFGSTKIANVRGALTLIPVSSIFFFGALFAIAGMPPSGIFFTKLAVLAEGMAAHPYLVGLALIAIAIVFAGFVRNAALMLLGPAPEDAAPGEANRFTLASLVILSAAFVVLCFFVPAPLMSLVVAAADIIN